MRKKRPVGIDLFAGAGGMSLGFEQAGFDVCAAVEIDPVHAAVHRFNFPACAVLPRSVKDLSGREIRAATSIGDARVDVVFGGAPCQGFSMIGQRVLDDPRNSLVREFVRLVTELDASYFVFENVKGLTVGRHLRFLEELIEAFEKQGYAVRRDWRVLNAASYKVPQDRERLFLLGAKNGLPLPEYPEPRTVRAGRCSELLLPSGPTCAEALGDLPDAESFSQLIGSDEVTTDRWQSKSEYSREMRCESPAAWHFGYRRNWRPNLLTSSIRTEHTEISRIRFAETKQGCVEPISRFFKLPADGVSNTLRAGTDSLRGAFTSPRPIHYLYPRCITVREMARLHGFPDWFRFHRTKWHGARQIGNSVPPPLARAVAETVMAAMGSLPFQPDSILSFDRETLLTMTVGQAANFWGVPTPTSKRDRKSGARKRSQKETERARQKLLVA